MPTLLTVSRAIAVGCVMLLVAACGATSASRAPSASSAASASGASAAAPKLLWPAPSDPLDRAVAAGLNPGPKEYGLNHVHAHLDVFVDGEPSVVPAGLGINTADPDVHTFTDPLMYGGIEICARPCISPLHTHDASGIIHTESADATPHTLGQLFTEWGVELSPTCVADRCAPTPIAVHVGGQRFDGDPRTIELTDRKVIVVVVGTPPAVIPSTADFSQA
jgi:hypothetical protein